MTTSKIQMQNALGQLQTDFNALYDLIPHPCGAQGPEEIYAIAIKSGVAAAIVLANNL